MQSHRGSEGAETAPEVPSSGPDDRFRLLLDLSPDAMLIVGSNGAIALVNRETERLFGYDAGELAGRLVGVLIPESLRAAHGRYLEAYFAAPQTRPMGVRLDLHGRRKDGTPIPVEISLRPVVSGADVYVAAAVRDTTDRREVAELRRSVDEARRAAAARLALLEAMPEAIAVVRRDGTIVQYKAASHVPVPFDPATLVGRNVLDLTYAPTAQIYELIQRAFSTRQAQHLQYDAVVDGVARTRSSTARAISDDEAIWVVRDVTEQHIAARRMAFAERLASLGTLAAGVAHELNNPLAYLTTNLSFLTERLGERGVLDEDEREALADARTGTERMRGIVNRLKTFSHPGEEASAVACLSSAVMGATKLASREVAAKGHLEVDLRGEFHVRGTEAQLSQVFLNLLLNAAQALDASQSARNVISVRAATLHGGRVAVEVCDNGPGIPVAARERVFEPFFTTKPVGEGTGLGLAIALQIVRAAGGAIELESIEGQGTVFRVILSLASARAERPSHRRVKVQSSARVLVVDDDRAVLSAMTRLLAAWKPTPVSGGLAALTLLEQETFDLILCDVTMPEFTGVDLYVEVARRWPGREGRMVLMTGGLLTDAQRARLGPTAPTILHKPFDVAAVEQCLARVSAVPAGVVGDQ